MSEEELAKRVRKLLEENMVKGHCSATGVDFHFTRPSPETYPYQFFWDTCFHAFIWSALEEYDMAKQHLKSLFSLQEDNGFVGHMIYWNNTVPHRFADLFQSRPGLKSRLFKTHMSALIQPPIVAQTVERIYRNSKDLEFVQEMLPKLKKYYGWLAENRDFDGDGMLTIISPFESGMDWKPTYDEPLGFPPKKADWYLFLKVSGLDFHNFITNYDLERIYLRQRFLVKDAGLNTVYVQNLYAMAELCKLAGEEGEPYVQLAERVQESMLKLMYDEEEAAFFDLYGWQNKKIRVCTPTLFFPVLLKEIPGDISEKVMKRHFLKGDEFDVSFPIPSLATSHPAFNPEESMYLWRGPTWVLNNWFMHHYLLDKGYTDEAKRLIDSILELIEKSGFREYYNPFTGEGYGARDFTWAGLVLDMIKMDKEYEAAKDK